MAVSIAHVVCEHTKTVVGEAKVFNFLADEVKSIDGQSWMSVHIYICIGFKCASILLALLQLVDGNSVDVVKEAIYTMFLWHTRLNQIRVAERLIFFAANGIDVLQGCRSGTTWQLKFKRLCNTFCVWCTLYGTSN
jgi:hypothetical protein